MTLAEQKTYTIDNIYDLPDGQRAELIDGQIYMMAPPNRDYQELAASYTEQFQIIYIPNKESVRFI